MAANCLIYRRCRANAINEPLYHEDSLLRSTSIVQLEFERKKYKSLPSDIIPPLVITF